MFIKFARLPSAILIFLLVNIHLCKADPIPGDEKQINIISQFTFTHEITFHSYNNKKWCSEDKGNWHDNACWFLSSDSVVFYTLKSLGTHQSTQPKDVTPDTRYVQVTTMGDNGHSCYFEGQVFGPTKFDPRFVVSEDHKCRLKITTLQPGDADPLPLATQKHNIHSGGNVRNKNALQRFSPLQAKIISVNMVNRDECQPLCEPLATVNIQQAIRNNLP